jgi:hypothetical protein
MAQPIIVAGATTEGGAQLGPIQVHGGGPYSLMAGDVKQELLRCWAVRSLPEIANQVFG